MTALVEFHHAERLSSVLDSKASLVGVNNRDLKRFVTDLAISERLAPLVAPGTTLVCESGIAGPQDIARMRAAGIHAFLVGEHLMRHEDVEAATCALLADSGS